jgi:gluconate 2-dehydrogenase alpha chain
MSAIFSENERRTLDVLFERMFPASPTVPGAIEIGAADYLCRALQGAYADAVETYRCVFRNLDAAADGNFAAAGIERQNAVIGSFEWGQLPGLWEERPGVTFELVYRHLREGLFGDPRHGGNRQMRGWHAVGFPGVEQGFSAAQQQIDHPHQPAAHGLENLPPDRLAKAPATSPAGQPDTADGTEPWGKADVVIVGGGAVGGFLARKLVLGGLRVVMLEAGPTRTGREHRMDEVSATAFRNEGGAAKFNREIPTWRRHAGEPATRAVRSQGLETALGGNSVAWGAVAMRFHADDFTIRSSTVARYGAHRLPPGSTLADWPLSYADLAPYYDEAEDLLGVSGQAWNADSAVPAGNPFEAPRARGYAMPWMPKPPRRTRCFPKRWRRGGCA